jgi:hypothetical protein
VRWPTSASPLLLHQREPPAPSSCALPFPRRACSSPPTAQVSQRPDHRIPL